MGLPLAKSVVTERLKGSGIRLLGDFKGTSKKNHFICDKGHEWHAVANNVITGHTGCPECSGNKRLTTALVTERLAPKGITLKGEFTKVLDPHTFSCDKGHTFTCLGTSALYSKVPCPHCRAIELERKYRGQVERSKEG